MRKILVGAVRIAAPVVVLVLGWMAFRAIGQRPDPVPRPPDEDLGALVETVPVEAVDVLTLDVDGLVVPYREISLAAEVGGRVTFKDERCKTGWYVEQGTKLFEIDVEAYETERDAAQAELEQARIDLEEVRTVERPNLEELRKLAVRKQEFSQSELERVRRLGRDDLATRATVEAAEQASLQTDNEVTTLANQLRMLVTKERRLEQAVKVADAKLATAERDSRRATVTAPTSGVVVEDSVELDGFVQKGAPLLVIEDTGKVEVRCNLTLDEMAWLWRDERGRGTVPTAAEARDEGAEPSAAAVPTSSPLRNDAYDLPPIPVTVAFEVAGRHYEWEGEFARFDGIGLDERTRTIPVRIEVPEPRAFSVDGTTAELGRGPRALLRGMFVDVRADLRPDEPLLRVPERSVRPGGDVWRYADGTLDIVPVDVAWREPGFVYVSSRSTPLGPGDRLIVTPLSDPRPGARLRLVERSERREDSGSE